MMKKYFYQNKQSIEGPFTLEEISMLINKNTFVWYEGLESWYPASQIEEINTLIPNNNKRKESFFEKPIYHFAFEIQGGWFILVLVFGVVLTVLLHFGLKKITNSDYANYVLNDLFRDNEILLVFLYFLILFMVSIYFLTVIIYFFTSKSKS